MTYSVIVPLYNEAGSLLLLHRSLLAVFSQLPSPFEIIYINDGSRDNTQKILSQLEAGTGKLRILTFDKNYGKSAALQAGYDHAAGDIIVTLDGDLQNDPQDIPRLLRKLEQGYDVVCGWRHNRQDNWMRRISSRAANFLRKLITREPVHDVGCALRVFHKHCLDGVQLTGPLHRFFTLILHKKGWRIAEIKVTHYPRLYDEAKYNLRNRFWESIFEFLRICTTNISGLMKKPAHYVLLEIKEKPG
jgi:glycosyltransferase involved in cell wall biosynthesis